MTLHGIDGCSGGWVVASSDETLKQISYEIIETDAIGNLIAESAPRGDLVIIDIPIGLADSEPRNCDLAARRYLGAPRGSSVFPAPCRATLRATDYASACALNFAACGRKISQQSFHILHKIRVVDRAMTPDKQCVVRESHPEVVFARLNGDGRGLLTNKKRVAGRAERRVLLEHKLGCIDVDCIRDGFGRRRLPTDDLLDALACLIAAHHVRDGNELVLPQTGKQFDARGLRMEIVA
ncbi:MAG: DUF429 domain-containing protein [Nitrolancea sp.]